MRRTATIHLEFSSEEIVKILLKAMLPETQKPATFRSQVNIKSEGKKLVIYVEAKDTSALRATLNSYLRWVALVKDTYEAAANSDRRTRENT